MFLASLVRCNERLDESDRWNRTEEIYEETVRHVYGVNTVTDEQGDWQHKHRIARRMQIK